MLANCLPKGNKTILMIGGGTKDLYYLPRDVLQATLVDPKADESFWQQAALQARTPVAVRKRPYEDLRFAPDASIGVTAMASTWPACGAKPRAHQLPPP